MRARHVELVENRLAVIRPCLDARGPYGVEAWADDCEAILDQFDMARAHVVGGSLGGTIAVSLAARLPARVASIVCIGSTLHTNTEALSPVLAMLAERGVQQTFASTLPEIGTAPSASSEVIERALSLSNPNSVTVVTEIWKAAIATDVRSSAAEVQCPALAVTGEYDRTCAPEEGAQIARALGTELVSLPNVGHLPMLENPDATARTVSAFLAKVEAHDEF